MCALGQRASPVLARAKAVKVNGGVRRPRSLQKSQPGEEQSKYPKSAKAVTVSLYERGLHTPEFVTPTFGLFLTQVILLVWLSDVSGRVSGASNNGSWVRPVHCTVASCASSHTRLRWFDFPFHCVCLLLILFPSSLSRSQTEREREIFIILIEPPSRCAIVVK